MLLPHYACRSKRLLSVQKYKLQEAKKRQPGHPSDKDCYILDEAKGQKVSKEHCDALNSSKKAKKILISALALRV